MFTPHLLTEEAYVFGWSHISVWSYSSEQISSQFAVEIELLNWLAKCLVFKNLINMDIFAIFYQLINILDILVSSSPDHWLQENDDFPVHDNLFM